MSGVCLQSSYLCFHGAVYEQRQSGLKTVDDMKSFVSQDLKYLMQQQSTLSYREYVIRTGRITLSDEIVLLYMIM